MLYLAPMPMDRRLSELRKVIGEGSRSKIVVRDINAILQGIDAEAKTAIADGRLKVQKLSTGAPVMPA